MKTIETNDIIYATLRNRGTTIASLCMSGISTMTEVIARLRREVGVQSGLNVLMLRNGTQGWSTTQSVILS